METFRDEIKKADLELRDKDLERLKRISEYRRLRLTKKIERIKNQIIEIGKSGTDKQKNIIPALKGQVRKAEEILGEQEKKYLSEKNIIEDQASAVSSKIWASYFTT